ncbi:MAG TPA: hypothetical protein VLE20_07010, partial [Blastocatellia bacterium]|nr:hypothetical protein [Blastocatellia bacterium]
METLIRALLLVLVIAAPCATSMAIQGVVEHKRVLILLSSDSYLPSQVIVEQALRSTLKNGSPHTVEVYSEYLDDARTGAREYEKELIGLLRRKYEGKKFDVIFAITDPALQIL